MKNVIELTKKLISIPSYVDKQNDEKQIGKFLYNYLKNNLKWLKVYKQKVTNTRINIIATKNSDPQLVFICHMDTVRPSGSKKRMLTPQIKENKLYGLGATDMKGGLAAALIACEEVSQTKNIALIFDCDEEYYFKGIKKVLEEYQFRPKLVICPEPTNLEIINGCRGVIEIEFECIGKTAHAGTPQKGINAIEKAVRLVVLLRKEMINNDLKELGTTTVNLSAINGARLQDGKIVIQANAVADIAKVLLDIRSANPNINAKKILKKITIIGKRGIIKDLKVFEKTIKESKVKAKYRKDLGKGGFYEAALVSNAWKCPAISFGPSPSEKAHQVDEYVDIKSLKTTKVIFSSFIKLF